MADPPPGLRAAATVVVLRPGPDGLEALLTRRPATMRFAPDLHVFPGGSLEGGETAEAAAIRETREETGLELSAGSLIALTRWVTPASQPARFDARFFAAPVPPGTDLAGPTEEVVSWSWLTPRAALDSFSRGDLVLWPPTIVTLQQLEGLRDVGAIKAALPAADGATDDGAGRGAVEIVRLDPALARIDGHSAGGVDGRAWTGWLVGRSSWVIVNPGDPTGATTDAVVEAAAAAGATLAGVVITDLQPDHHAGASLFCVGLGLPLAGPAGSPLVAREPILGLDDGADLPFGDGAVRVRVRERSDAGARANRRWADGFPALTLEGAGWSLPDGAPGRD